MEGSPSFYNEKMPVYSTQPPSPVPPQSTQAAETAASLPNRPQQENNSDPLVYKTVSIYLADNLGNLKNQFIIR